MKIGLVIALVVGAASLGAGGVFVAEQTYWSGELKVQLVEKDKLLAQLKADADNLRQGLAALQKTNADMRTLIDASLKDSADVARSNQSSLEKIRGIIGRLQQLQIALKAPGVTE